MILGISSNLETFKPLEFKPGLNILLADRSKTKTNTHSLNGVGKSCFVELVHYLLGINLSNESIFKRNELKKSEFILTIGVNEEKIEVKRGGMKQKSITLKGNINHIFSEAIYGDLLGECKISNDQWQVELEKLWFDMSVAANGKESNYPTFRSLFSYFARRQNEGGFNEPIEYSKAQQTWSKQVSLSFLLGLDWHLPAQLEELKKKEYSTDKEIEVFQKFKSGHHFGEPSEIEKQLTKIKEEQKDLTENLSTFTVEPKYKEFGNEVTEINKQIDELNSKNLLDNQLIRGLEESISMERVEEVDEIPKVYEEVKFLFPEIIQRRIEEVQRFQVTIVKNRQSHLQSEISSANQRIIKRDRKIQKLDERRKELMEILNSENVLDPFTNLQKEIGRLEAERKNLTEQLELSKEIESQKEDVKIEQINLAEKLSNDLLERSEIINEVKSMFNLLSHQIFGEPGNLNIVDESTGLNFEVNIAGKGSKGIANMLIFCFDHMIMEFNMKRNKGPRFLIHDSHLFDSVDRKHIAKALQVGANQATKYGFQYIVTMNSDVLPREYFDSEFPVDDYILSTVLTDKAETGGLFGLSF